MGRQGRKGRNLDGHGTEWEEISGFARTRVAVQGNNAGIQGSSPYLETQLFWQRRKQRESFCKGSHGAEAGACCQQWEAALLIH
jgi:hypothetical protein